MKKNSPEELYSKNTKLAHRKKYAQFFTPEPVSEFMVKWLTELPELKKVLEPAFGLGIFSRTLLKYSRNIEITGFEIDKKIYHEIQSDSLLPNKKEIQIKNEDYLLSQELKDYDGIICNPPYLKFHEYDNNLYVEKLNKKLGISLAKTSNLYVLFLLKSLSELRIGGRAAHILPSEFLNSNYGVAIKEYLLQSRMLKHLFIVNNNLNIFEDATTTTAILFLENSKDEDFINFYIIDKDIQFNKNFHELIPFSKISYNELSSTKKWRNYYELENSKKYLNLIDFSEYAQVKRGIATGANEYFSFNKSKANAYVIPKKCLIPTITKANQIKGNFLNDSDLDKLIKQDKKVFLLDAQKDEDDKNIQNYIDIGIKEGVSDRYLTKKRKPWYKIEERDVAPILVGVFNRNGLKFIRNESKAKNLTSYHCVYVHKKHIDDIELLFAYLITDTARNIFNDHSRDYGNGLKKFEPNDLNDSKILDLSVLSQKEKKVILNHLENFKKTQNEVYISKIDNIFNKKYSIK